MKKNFQTNLKVNDLIYNWDILDICSEFLNLVGCFIPEGKNVNAAPNEGKIVTRPTDDATFHAKPLGNTGDKLVSNMKTNKLVPSG